jgi:dipeptidyl aminopeptidase/acylaminoacyl peptidase
MNKTIALTLVALFTTLSLFAARPITDKDLLRFRWIGAPQVSPDGSQVAYVVVTVDEKGDRYQTSLWSVATVPGSAPHSLTNGPRDTSPRWSPDGRTLAFLRAAEKDGKPEPPQVYLLSMSGGEPRAVTTMPKGIDRFLWSPNGKTLALLATNRPSDLEEKKEKKDDEKKESDVRIINHAVYRTNGAGYADPTRFSHIWTVDVPAQAGWELAKAKQLTSGELDEDDVAWSADGSRLYFTSNRTPESYYDAPDSDLFAIPATGGETIKVADIHGPIGSLAPSPDGQWIAFTGYETGKDEVRSYNESDLFVVGTAAGSQPRNLTAGYSGDVLTGLTGDQHAPRGGRPAVPLWSSDSKAIYVTTGVEGSTNLVRVDLASGKLTPWTSGKHEVVTYSIAGGRSVALVSTPTMIGDLFTVDDKGALTRLTDINQPLFDELALGEPEEIWYPSFDGRKIQAWVQKPVGFDPARKYPLILNIHGGPHAAYGYTFDHEFQWMAAKGYVVLFPNPRGSSTYGEEFGNVIQYKYPGDDYKDLMAGVDVLIARGMIDPKKLAITGGSGGGVLTNWAVTQTDRFAAAASQRSIADWSTFWYGADFSLFRPSWFRKAPWEDPQDFTQRSAITFIDRVHTPLMLIEGESDMRTPPMAGGEMMFRALKYLHRPTVMIRFPDETHELSRSGKPSHRIERLQHIVNWFDKWVLGQPIDLYDKGLRK